MTLHIISKKLGIKKLQQATRLLDASSAILLINDGVYTLLGEHAELLKTAIEQQRLYCLREDALARGLSEQVITEMLGPLKLIDYEQFVLLTTQHNPIHTWY